MMRPVIYRLILGIPLLFLGCSISKKPNEKSFPNESIFPKGEIVKNNNFTGVVWLQMMGANDTTLHAGFGNVTFEPGARTNWHSHPGGQLLFVTEGKGYYQEKGQPARLLHRGDVVEIPRNVVHWHGAASDSQFAHMAVSLNTDDGGAAWLGPVTDEEYLTASKDEADRS